ncbi:hypothetical protein CHS0354_034246 [Potamilus streckersoni]|uniref:Uncharacterized protein n=1 Tax=Potamilus streckersoni TaxID=2493646 RepID=A0AAE0VUB7_9BIVA|nr:hypothetical protein CHS0354_034246 [Potamilus streckersoni]
MYHPILLSNIPLGRAFSICILLENIITVTSIGEWGVRSCAGLTRSDYALVGGRHLTYSSRRTPCFYKMVLLILSATIAPTAVGEE